MTKKVDLEEAKQAILNLQKAVQEAETASKKLSFQEVAANKGLEAPGEETTLISTVMSFGFSNKKFKGSTMQDFAPTDDELDLINSLALVPQSASDWMVLRDINPIGIANAIDSQGDKFAKKAEQDLVEQAFNTPVLVDHDHSIGDRPPVGTCIKSRLTGKGPRETYAIPLTDYNENIVKGLVNGTINKLSVGMLIHPENKQCDLCHKSIYSWDCQHMPGMKDESGKTCSVTIKNVDRYLERSFVNVPARTNTSVKNEGADTISSVKTIEDSIVPKEPKEVETVIDETETSKGIDAEAVKAALDASEKAKAKDEDDECLAAAKAKEDEEKAAKDKEDAEKAAKEDEEKAAKKKKDDEEKASKPDYDSDKPGDDKPAKEKALKSLEDAVSEKSMELKELKAIADSLAVTVKAQADRTNKLIETVTKQAESLDKLTELQKGLAESVAQAMQISTQETLEKLIEVAKYNADQGKAKKAKEIDVKSNSDWVTTLFGPNAH